MLYISAWRQVASNVIKLSDTVIDRLQQSVRSEGLSCSSHCETGQQTAKGQSVAPSCTDFTVTCSIQKWGTVWLQTHTHTQHSGDSAICARWWQQEATVLGSDRQSDCDVLWTGQPSAPSVSMWSPCARQRGPSCSGFPTVTDLSWWHRQTDTLLHWEAAAFSLPLFHHVCVCVCSVSAALKCTVGGKSIA